MARNLKRPNDADQLAKLIVDLERDIFSLNRGLTISARPETWFKVLAGQEARFHGSFVFDGSA